MPLQLSFLIGLFVGLTVGGRIGAPSARYISASVGQNGWDVSMPDGIKHSVQTVRVGDETRHRVRVTVPGHLDVQFGPGSSSSNFMRQHGIPGYSPPSYSYPANGYSQFSFSNENRRGSNHRTENSGYPSWHSSSAKTEHRVSSHSDDDERVVQLPQWEKPSHNHHHHHHSDKQERLSSIKPLTLDIVYPKECECVPVMFCNEHHIDRTAGRICEDDRVCCHREESISNNLSTANPATEEEGSTYSEEGVLTQGGRGEGAFFQGTNRESMQASASGEGRKEGEKSEESHEGEDPGVFAAEETTLTSAEQVQTFLVSPPSKDAGRPAPLTNGCPALIPPKCEPQPPPKCNCRREAHETSTLSFRGDDESQELVIEEGIAQPEEEEEIICGLERRHLLLEHKISTKTLGKYAEFAEFPWTVLVMLSEPRAILCSGVLVHPRWALTTAHCVADYKEKRSSLIVRAGELNTNHTLESYDYEELGVKKVVVHNSYKKLGLHNDIALLELDGTFDLSLPHINQICLPDPDLPPTMPCIVTGWGAELRHDELVANRGAMKKVEVRTISRSDCEGKMRKTELGPKFNLAASTLCAEPVDPKIDTHLGDGGGPLFCKSKTIDERAVLVGLVSWGKTDIPDTPGVYTSVRAFRSWLNKYLYES